MARSHIALGWPLHNDTEGNEAAEDAAVKEVGDYVSSVAQGPMFTHLGLSGNAIRSAYRQDAIIGEVKVLGYTRRCSLHASPLTQPTCLPHLTLQQVRFSAPVLEDREFGACWRRVCVCIAVSPP